MRINIYAEEITTEVEIMSKEVTDEKFGTRTFYGVRFYLLSPKELHSTPEDDDRSAITFWIPWNKKYGHDTRLIANLLNQMNLSLHAIDTAILSVGGTIKRDGHSVLVLDKGQTKIKYL